MRRRGELKGFPNDATNSEVIASIGECVAKGDYILITDAKTNGVLRLDISTMDAIVKWAKGE